MLAKLGVTMLLGLILVVAGCSRSPTEEFITLTVSNETVHNSHYLRAAFLYQLQTLIGAADTSANVLTGDIVVRDGKETRLNLARLKGSHRRLLRELASSEEPADELSADELGVYFQKHYYELTEPYKDLDALLGEHRYRQNPDWLHIPVDSATFRRRRVLHINKDRIADALTQYFDNADRVIYPEGTVIVAESFTRDGAFVEAEVLRKRRDTFWNFSVYDEQGTLSGRAVAFDEEGNVDSEAGGFQVPRSCAVCHRIDRLDFSGDPEAPMRAPIHGFFHRLPAHVPQIHLGAEYYDHAAFTELTEASGRVKDGVFGVYGSLLLSELKGRAKLEALSEGDVRRYRRLEALYPELLTSLDKTESFVNSVGMKFMRIPAPPPGTMIGSLPDEPDYQTDEKRHAVAINDEFFLQSTEVTNRQFRMFRPRHRSGSYRGVNLDGPDYPVVRVSQADALAFVEWLNGQSREQEAGWRYRLPSEEEWEYAARGGDHRRFPWGDDWPPPRGAGNLGDTLSGAHFQWEALAYYQDPYIGTAPARQFFPNPFFLYDLAGNVYEWTSSSYKKYPGAGPGKEEYGDEFIAVRGSSWADELPKVFRCSFRLPRRSNDTMPFLGFRLAADATDSDRGRVKCD